MKGVFFGHMRLVFTKKSNSENNQILLKKESFSV